MWFSAMDTCPAYFTEWLGLIPLQVATCAAVVRPCWPDYICIACLSMEHCDSHLAVTLNARRRECKLRVVVWRCCATCCLLACKCTALQVANAIFMMPRDRHDSNPVVQAMLQGLSWCEKHRSADLASRNAYLTSHGKVQPLLQPPLSLACSEVVTLHVLLSTPAFHTLTTPPKHRSETSSRRP